MSGPLEISLKDKLLFIESLLVPSFNHKNKLNTPEAREEWLKTRGVQKKWNEEHLEELIERHGTILTLEEAKAEKTKVEGMLEKESKQGKNFIRSTFIVFTLLIVVIS